MTEDEAKTSTSNFLSVHPRSREVSPAKSDGDSERPGKRRGLKWFKSIRKAVGAIGGFRKRSAVPVQRSHSVISIEKLDNIETVVIQDVRKDRPKGPQGRKRSSQMMKLNSQNKLVTVQSVIVEESESKDSLKEDSLKEESESKDSLKEDSLKEVKEEESVLKDRPKGSPGCKRSNQVMKRNSQNKLVTVQSVVVEESESKDSLKEDSLKEDSLKEDSLKEESESKDSLKEESLKEEESVVKEEESVVKEEESVLKEEIVENGVHDKEDEEKETVSDSVVSLSQDIVLEEEESLSALSKKAGSEVASEESAA